MTLRTRTFTAVRWTTAAAVSRAVLQMAQLVVLARLLSPEDYGLMAMVGVVLGFGALFSDLGINSAYVQRQHIDEAQRSSLYWFSVVVGAALSGVLMAAAPLLAAFFGDARLVPILRLAALTLVLGALGQQLKLTAEKQLDFKPVAVIEVVTALLGFAATVLMAWQGLGVYAMVYSAVLAAALTSALFWVVLARGWRPIARFAWRDVQPFVGFGGATVANNVVNQINVSFDVFLGGRLLTAAQLGLYAVPRNLALQVQMLVNPVVTRVGFPLISMVQSDPTQVRSIFLKSMNMTSSINAPVYAALFVFAPEVVQILLGRGWEESVELLRALALWGAVRSTANPVGSLLLGMGRAGLSLKWNLGLLLVFPPALWAGAQWQAPGMAWALLLAQSAVVVPGWFLLIRPLCHAGLASYLLAAFRPFVLAGAAAALGFVAASLFDSGVVRLATGCALGGLAYLALSRMFNREWVWAMLELVRR